MNGGRQHMPVVGVGKLQPWDQIVIARDEGVWSMEVHQRAGPLELLVRESPQKFAVRLYIGDYGSGRWPARRGRPPA